MRISEILERLKATKDHLAFCVYGPRGTFKTTHLYGIYEEIKEAGFDVIFAFDVSDMDFCDCLILDDFASKFYKRDSQTKQSKEFMKILQEVRTNVPLIVASAPHISLFDKDFRAFFLDAYIISLGLISIKGFMIEVNPPSIKLYKEMKQIEHKRRRERFLKVINSFKAQK